MPRTLKPDPSYEFIYLLMLILGPCLLLHFVAVEGLLGDLSHASAPVKKGRSS